jgi:nucleotide-binding universal stress UspA family protein
LSHAQTRGARSKTMVVMARLVHNTPCRRRAPAWEPDMSKRQRILVPTDFSEPSGHALDLAISLARRTGASIDLLHAYSIPGRAFSPYDIVFPDEIVTSVRDWGRRQLVSALERVRSAGIEGEPTLVEGAPADAIQAAVSEKGIDWVVMGTRGISGWKHALLGSVAERTLRSVACPVFTVKGPTDGDSPLHLRRILVAHDFSAPAERALRVARDLAELAGPSALTLVHALYVPASVQPYLDLDQRGLLEEASRGLESRLAEAAREAEKSGLDVSIRVSTGTPERVIAEAAEEEGADCVVMGTHGRTGLPHVVLGSVAERVVRDLPCPTVTVRPETSGEAREGAAS